MDFLLAADNDVITSAEEMQSSIWKCFFFFSRGAHLYSLLYRSPHIVK